MLEFNLIGKSHSAFLVLELDIKGVTPSQPVPEITPQHYRIIDELYVPPNKTFDLPNIHSFYLTHLHNHRLASPHYVSFSRVKQLFDVLKIDELVNKFYLVSPFKDYLDTQHKASAVF
jgi:hypothetical protein